MGRIRISDDGKTAVIDGTGNGVLEGVLRMPGDKSISHRAVMFGALARGETRVTGCSNGEDVAHSIGVVQDMGAVVHRDNDGCLRITGCAGEMREPRNPTNVGNAGTGLRLFTGLWAGQDGLAVFFGDASLATRPIGRVAEPLRTMGATIDGREGRYTPVVVRGSRNLRSIEYTLPVASAQTKSAVLLAGLSADGVTTVHEPVLCRQHTEELLELFGAKIVRGDGFASVERSVLTATDVVVPGDPSQAAFWACAAAGAVGSRVECPGLYIGQGRLGFVDILRRMGADIVAEGDTVVVTGAQLKACSIAGRDIPDVIDEVPVLAVASAMANGTTTIRGAEELRIKESDRIETTAAMLRAFGVGVAVYKDGLDIEGTKSFMPGVVDSHGDHRIAMAAALLALSAPGQSEIRGWESVATSYPDFAAHLETVT